MRPLCIGVAVTALVAAAAAGASPRGESQVFDRGDFDTPTAVDNRFHPLTPGTQLIYSGSNLEGKRRVGHRLISTVTDLTKVIDGVRTVVLWERDYSEGRLVEAELAFFAQDNDGNVWQLGEYPEEYERGRFVEAPAWIHGLERARAGIAMPARPRLGTPSYAQGYAPEVDWFDRAKVDKLGVRTCVPAGCFRNVLVTDEFSRNDPRAHQLKYYAPGVGNVRVGWRGKDSDQETLVLLKIRQLRPGGFATARREALRLENHAYMISKDVYGQTPPAERAPAAGNG
jgi:hypothetical protein